MKPTLSLALLLYAVLALTACQGVSMTDPSVRTCYDHTDSVVVLGHNAIGRPTLWASITVKENAATCRKAK